MKHEEAATTAPESALQRRLALPLSAPLLALLALAYILPGLIGHDPWKTEDAIGIGIVHQMLAHGQWLLPHVAGEAYLEDGPLFYWVAALLAKATTVFLPEHDGARLASAAMLAATLACTYGAGRILYDRSSAATSAVVLLGCLGLLVHSHEALAEMGLLAGHALAYFGMALLLRRAPLGGALLGLGLAAAFMSKGLPAAVVPATVALLLPFASRSWRTRRYASGLALAVLFAAALGGSWLALVETRAPGLAADVLAAQLSTMGWPSAPGSARLLQILAWATWPAWPIALWSLWEQRRRNYSPGTRMLIVAAIAALVVALAQRDLRDLSSFMLLVPLALLAGPGGGTLRRGAASALAWFGATSALLFGSFVWRGWFAMSTGWPAQLARNFAKLEPGHQPQFLWLPFAAALVLTLAWIALVLRTERSVYQGTTYWTAGLVIIWGLVMTLWLSWIDYGKSYRSVAQALQSALPAGARCIESRGLGLPQRAVFDYHAGIVTTRLESNRESRCPLLLIQGQPGRNDRIGPGWRLIWEGARPRDRERYRLYRRT
jgi:4-amino-4-deoxy-L-arabinose transferase-like glycosyltransferase